MRKLYSIFFVMLISLGAYAQDGGVEISSSTTRVEGQILDENGDAMVGASVVAKGTTVGTTTDVNGNFVLSVPSGATALVVTYIGYGKKEVPIESGKRISVALEPASIGLDDVVVSASKKREKLLDAPASISVISADKIETNVALTPVDHLAKVPGVDVMQTGLVSGNVAVRGFNNIFSGSVLTMVDNRITNVPSLKVNAYQLIQTSNSDIEKIELVRGPGSALYGPNAADGVLHIMTKSPLEMDKKLETTVTLGAGYREGDGDNLIFIPELRIAGKPHEKVGFKISGGYTKATDWTFYDDREPAVGDTIVFGNVQNGELFVRDTTIAPSTFDRDFDIEKFNIDGRLDFAITDDLTLTLNGGMAQTSNIELTGLGAAQGVNWVYWYTQARLAYKDLYFNYFTNSSDAGDTYLIPQVGNDTEPHNIQFLVDKSKMHVVQLQHNSRPVDDLQLTYGADIQMTRPETEGTINGRYEDEDDVNQYGAYLQGEYAFSEKFKVVGAFRGDYHDVIDEFQFSPRGALVYKPSPRHTTRFTYNRAFSSPTSLNLFLDISNGQIPNGIDIRGIGNPNGYNYIYGDNGLPQFYDPYNQTWRNFGDQSANAAIFHDQAQLLKQGLALDLFNRNIGLTFGQSLNVVDGLITSLLDGIQGDTGTINTLSHIAFDYVDLLENGDISSAVIDPTKIVDLEPIESSITQTFELGYKGIIKDKLFLSVDAYYTEIDNFSSPLTTSSYSVAFEPNSLVGLLGPPQPGGTLFDNMQKPSPLDASETIDESLVDLLDGNPAYGNNGVANGTSYDELVYVILNQANFGLTAGTVAPDDDKVGEDIILTYVNLGKIDVAGFDLGFTYMVNEDVSFSGALSHVNKDRIPLEGTAEGYVGLNAPKWKSALGIDHSFSDVGFGYGLNWRWQDGFPANSALYIGDVHAANLIDLKLSYKPKFFEDRTTLITLNVNNVLGYEHQRFPGTPQIGRVYMAKIQQTF